MVAVYHTNGITVNWINKKLILMELSKEQW